jgi:NTP pyrophosphatase (non-canonical NTP hydrolase)
LEHFQWKTDAEFKEYFKTAKSDVADELIDVLYWVLLMSHDLDIDLLKAFEKKMAKNNIKYPVTKATDSHKKYTEL